MDNKCYSSHIVNFSKVCYNIYQTNLVIELENLLTESIKCEYKDVMGDFHGTYKLS